MGTINDMIRKLGRLQTELKNISGKTITIVPDANGMIDKQCPKKECNSHFKVKGEDWKTIVKDEEVFCPFCRNNSPAKEYFPTEQRKQIEKSIRGAIMGHWNYSTSISENIASIESKEEFELSIQCKNCTIKFAVIGAAYFCPCCGFSVIEENIKGLIEKLILKAEKIDVIQNSLEHNFTKDEAAVITKSILENSITECVGMLQSFSELKYNNFSISKAPFNAFQNIDKANDLWIKLKGQGYETWLSNNERRELEVFTQRRHLLEHKGGIVDSKYLENTKDSNYVLGDRIVVRATDIMNRYVVTSPGQTGL